MKQMDMAVWEQLAVILWVLFAVVCWFIMPFYAKISTDSPEIIDDVIEIRRIGFRFIGVPIKQERLITGLFPANAVGSRIIMR